MATNDIQERMQALWQAAEAAIRSDPSYSIALAEESTKAKKRQSQVLAPRTSVGV